MVKMRTEIHECSECGRHPTKSFLYIISFNPHKDTSGLSLSSLRL